MAEFVFANLTIDGNALEESDEVTTIHEMAGQDTSKFIECNEVTFGVTVPMEAATGVHARGARQQMPMTFSFRLGCVGPLIHQALTENKPIAGDFLFFRQNSATGESEHFYTVTVSDARFAEAITESPNCLNPETASLPVLMHCKLVAHTTAYIDCAGNGEYEDNWAARR